MSTTSLLVESAPVLAQGALLTIKFALFSMFFGLIAAVVLALMGISQNARSSRSDAPMSA